MPDALEIADKTYVNVNIHKKENEDKLKQLAGTAELIRELSLDFTAMIHAVTVISMLMLPTTASFILLLLSFSSSDA